VFETVASADSATPARGRGRRSSDLGKRRGRRRADSNRRIGVLQTSALTSWPRRPGAEDGIRTRDLLLAKEMGYHCPTSASNGPNRTSAPPVLRSVLSPRPPVLRAVRVRGFDPPRELAPNSPSSWRVYLIPPHPRGTPQVYRKPHGESTNGETG